MNHLPTIRQAVEAIERSEITPIDLLDHCLERIDQFDERIRAWVLVDHESARREAERLTQLAQKGEIVGPLHGVPVGVKDIIDVAGMPTKAGSPLRENILPADHDAPVVANLRRAGAIILGKTVTTEWACFDPPPTRNPWNLNHTPGGSSSGSAAAVAMEMCLAALGTQTGGSIIRPAAYCGVVGLKPTFGAVSLQGVIPVSHRLDHLGPIAKCVDDAMILLDVLRKDYASTASTPDRLPSWGILRDFLSPHVPGGVPASVRQLLGKWQSMGGELPTEVNLPDSFANVHELHRRIMAYEAARVHEDQYLTNPNGFGPNVAGLIREGLSLSEIKYQEAATVQDSFRCGENSYEDSIFRECDVILMASTPAVAPASLETTGDPSFNSPWSFTGFPAITIRAGYSAAGLPRGWQLVARPNHESDLARVATFFEKHLEVRGQPRLLRS